MRVLKYMAVVTLLCIVSAMSYYTGRGEYEKCYEDACHMSDLIRCYKDHLSAEDAIIEDYGCFEELEGNFLYDDAVGNPVDLKKYTWCY